MSHRILVLNGPNLNMLGIREPGIYGSDSLSDIEARLRKIADKHQVALDVFQSNAEFELINRIHDAMGKYDFILINPAAFTHTSVAIRDALLAVNIPFYEIHISNVHSREEFRHHSFLSDKAQGVICGFGTRGYDYALHEAIARILN